MSTSPPPRTRRELRRGAQPASEARSPVLEVLFVCTGNVCRSPMAEALLRARLGDGIRVRSAGTRALTGRPMDERASRLAIVNGARADDVAAHRARQLTASVLAGADLVLPMARDHRTAAVELDPALLRRTLTVREFARLAAHLEDEDIRRAADAAGEDARERLSAVVTLLAAQRGLTAPAPPAEDDVVDPYRREQSVYERSAAQLVPAIEEVARVLRAALC